MRSRTLPDDVEDTRNSGIPRHPEATNIALGAAAGAVAGIAFGSVGGPIGITVGGILGAVGGGGVADIIARVQEHRFAHDQRVDADIGVIGGDIGAADPSQPPPYIGAYSSGSAGGAGTSVDDLSPDEGPIPKAG